MLDRSGHHNWQNMDSDPRTSMNSYYVKQMHYMCTELIKMITANDKTFYTIMRLKSNQPELQPDEFIQKDPSLNREQSNPR